VIGGVIVKLLGLLHDHVPMGQGEIGETMGGVDPSILVTLLNPPEAAGFVSRERDPADRRRRVVTLTAAGRRHFDSATRAQREAEDALFAGLDEEQRREGACPPPEATEGC
jgi:DNA-binding MarR family transcriptional regulator